MQAHVERRSQSPFSDQPSMADEKKHRSVSSDSLPEVAHQDQAGSPRVTTPTEQELSERRNAAVRAENPLSGKSKEELTRLAEEYCSQHGFTTEDDIRVFRLGALIAGNDFQWDNIPGLTAAEVAGLELERDHKWKSLPKTLVGVVVVCVSTADARFSFYQPTPPPPGGRRALHDVLMTSLSSLHALRMLTLGYIGTVRCRSRNG